MEFHINETEVSNYYQKLVRGPIPDPVEKGIKEASSYFPPKAIERMKLIRDSFKMAKTTFLLFFM